MSKHERTREAYICCDNCNKEIKILTWYRLFRDERHDFCSSGCAAEFRENYYKIVSHDEYPRVMGNTD